MSLPISTLKAPCADRESGVHPAQGVDTVKLIYKPVARRVTHQVLVDKNRSQSQPDKGIFGHLEVEHLFSAVWDIYCELMPNESCVPVHGGRMNTRMTCLSVAFFEVLSAAGIERGYAIELISEISWKTYDKWRLFSGMNLKVCPEPAPAHESGVRAHDPEGRVSLPVPYSFPGRYRQVGAEQRDRVVHKLRPSR